MDNKETLFQLKHIWKNVSDETKMILFWPENYLYFLKVVNSVNS